MVLNAPPSTVVKISFPLSDDTSVAEAGEGVSGGGGEVMGV